MSPRAGGEYPSAGFDRIRRKLSEAEGYLILNLPHRALEILQGKAYWATMRFEASALYGEALRSVGRYREALRPLETAHSLKPEDVGVAVALGWCYKRTNRLAQAIDTLTSSLKRHPEMALLHYNLACYWSLASNASRALAELKVAIKLDPEFRDMASSESDFNAIRSLPEFESLFAKQTTAM